jgi:hypothetical protein
MKSIKRSPSPMKSVKALTQKKDESFSSNKEFPVSGQYTELTEKNPKINFDIFTNS